MRKLTESFEETSFILFRHLSMPPFKLNAQETIKIQTINIWSLAIGFSFTAKNDKWMGLDFLLPFSEFQIFPMDLLLLVHRNAIYQLWRIKCKYIISIQIWRQENTNIVDIKMGLASTMNLNRSLALMLSG